MSQVSRRLAAFSGAVSGKNAARKDLSEHDDEANHREEDPHLPFHVKVCTPTRDGGEEEVEISFLPDDDELPKIDSCRGACLFTAFGLDETVWREARRRALKALLDAEDVWLYFDLTAASMQRIVRLVENGGDASDVILKDLVANRRPPDRDDLFYARMAELYVDCGCSADRMHNKLVESGEHWSPATIRQWIFKAREKGLLSEAPASGHSGGELTDSGRALLDPPHGPVDPPEREIVDGSGGLLYARKRST